METSKEITIYLPPMPKSLNKGLSAKQKEIEIKLKGTPFEKDTNTIFEHLVKVQGALHFSGEKERISIAKAKRDLDLINTLLVLFHSNPDVPKLKSDVIEESTHIPKEVIAAMKNVAKELYDKNLSLCHQSVVKYKRKDEIKENGTIVIRPEKTPYFQEKEDKNYCVRVVVGEYSPITDLNHLLNQKQKLEKIQGHAGNKTNEKDEPHILTDTFRMLCAIKGFCKCDGFEKWGKRGNAERNRCIFECLQVFAIADDRKYLDANTQRSRVRDAEIRNIVFVSLPL